MREGFGEAFAGSLGGFPGVHPLELPCDVEYFGFRGLARLHSMNCLEYGGDDRMLRLRYPGRTL